MRLISGGQTGVDQAALRAAQASGLEIGGWCPPDRSCESGQIPARFRLQETPEERSPKAPDIPRSLRTEWNVRDSDATLILRELVPVRENEQDPGTTWTFQCAILYGKPLLLCDPRDTKGTTAGLVRMWLDSLGVETLNVGGPAESTQPGIGLLAETFLLTVLP
jgi:hypothetical protein